MVKSDQRSDQKVICRSQSWSVDQDRQYFGYNYTYDLHVLLGKCKSLIFFLTRLEDWRVRFLQSPLLDPTVEAEVVFRIQWEARGRRRLHQFDSIRNSIRIRNSKRTKNTCSLILSIATGTGVIKKNYPKNFQYSYSSVVVLLKFIGINSTVYI